MQPAPRVVEVAGVGEVGRGAAGDFEVAVGVVVVAREDGAGRADLLADRAEVVAGVEGVEC